MKEFKYIWLVGLLVTVLLIGVPILFVARPAPARADDPWANVPPDRAHTDHTNLMNAPFADARAVTRRCLECHEDAAEQVMHTAHWNWEGDPVLIDGHDEPVAIGKKTLINNFCIGIQSNWPSCTACHAGYGWVDQNFDFDQAENVDCLVCHEQSGIYVKGEGGLPVEGVDLLAVAQSVAEPTRQNCGSCHFNGGGGDAVKHGDLDQTLYFPPENVDVHMGRYDFQCTDCHRTRDHQVAGRSISVSVDNANQIACTDCHAADLHADARINGHVDSVACQTCHIPEFATKQATKTHWDWSTAGQDIEADPHEYLKIKGSFLYESNVRPEYYWYNGTADRYLLGDAIDPAQVTPLNQPGGNINDPAAKIWPFKVHYGNQIYDSVNNYLIQPMTAGEGGFWDNFDWDDAARRGMEVIGLPYSGSYDFAQTTMFWPTTHMVVPKERALQCVDCHGDSATRFDWEALGYFGDPIEWGGRAVLRELLQIDPAAGNQ